MDGEHAQVQQQEIHDAYQAYHTHAAYLDHAQAQAIASCMPDFVSMEPATQEATLQQYAQGIHSEAQPQEVEEPNGQQVHQSETESDLEEGMDAGRLGIRAFDRSFSSLGCHITMNLFLTNSLQLNSA